MLPELFEIPFLGWSVKSYGLMLAIGFLAGLWNADRRARRNGIDPEPIGNLAVILLISGVLGARLLYVALNLEQYEGDRFAVFRIWEGGLVFYGGLLAATGTGILYAWGKKLPVWNLADVIAPSIALGYGIARFGCFLNGCCWGDVCSPDAWYGVRFPALRDGSEFSPIFQLHLHEGAAEISDSWSAPVIPTQLLEVASGLLLFFLLARLYPRRSFPGQVFALLLLGYAALRFAIEFLRGDVPVFPLFAGVGLTVSQTISLLLFGASCGLYAFLRSRRSFSEKPY